MSRLSLRRSGRAVAWGALQVAQDRLSPPPRPEPTPVYGDAAPLPADRPLTIASWNLQFCAGRSAPFFYEGGPRVHVEPHHQDEATQGIIDVLRAIDADVVLLQEVDVAADRTQRRDQRRALGDALGYPVWTSAPYHQVPFVPVPWGRPMGRVDMHLVIFSRFRVSWAVRHPLALMREGPMRRAFNLRRQILEARLPVASGGEWAVVNTHFSAFSEADGTLDAQAQALEALLGARDRERVPWIAAGDLNALPPWDRPSRLPSPARDEYLDSPPPLARLYGRWPGIFRPPDLPPGTYVPYGSDTPDRAIDHLLHSPQFAVSEGRVVAEGAQWSDHLPVVARVGRIDR